MVVLTSRASIVFWGAALGLFASPGCKPSFDDDLSIVSSPKILAVATEPAEVAPREAFSIVALVADADGPRPDAALDFAICTLRKPLGEPGPVNEACFAPAGEGLVALGVGASSTATMPDDACRLFGPESPPPEPGQPGGRPVDPDVTGGYYLPVRLWGGGDAWGLASERIACNPDGVTPDVLTAWARGAKRNANPALAALEIVSATGVATPVAADGSDGARASVGAGERVTLRASWERCPTEATCGDGFCSAGEDATVCASDCARAPRSCAGAEIYDWVDPATHAIATRREAIVASWFATAGAFDAERDGRAADDRETSVENGWTAPATPGIRHLWVVLRDDRGGTGWGSFTIDVRAR